MGEFRRLRAARCDDAKTAVMDDEPVESDVPHASAGAILRQRQRTVAEPPDGQRGTFDHRLGEANGAARELDERQFESRQLDRQRRRVRPGSREAGLAEAEVGRRQQTQTDGAGNLDARADHRPEARLDLRAMRGPVDEQGDHERGAEGRHQRDRDDRQDIAHGAASVRILEGPPKDNRPLADKMA